MRRTIRAEKGHRSGFVGLRALGVTRDKKMQNLWVPYLARALDPESDQHLMTLLDM